MPWRVEVKEDPGGLLLQEILSTHSTTLLFRQKMFSSCVLYSSKAQYNGSPTVQ
jgi:predicted ATP-dependent endonuclease of OLD family